ncbi:MAG TPA: hypothetical protein VGO27_13460, partial [Candidatus Acidoferrum sp.]|nr:hypothetical protein [Candidatus Acidoferrum sp.]
MDAVAAIGGGFIVLLVLHEVLRWMATGEVRFLPKPISVGPARWQDQPVAFVVHMLGLFVFFV